MSATLRSRTVNRRMLAVDYPRQNEVITSPRCTVRVFAPRGAKRVGISIDQGPWKSCRPSVGVWRYDWSGFESGEHELVASMALPGGGRVISEPHEFFVELGPSPP